MLGFVALILAAVFAAIAAFSYGMSILPGTQGRRDSRRSGLFYNLSFGCVIVASAYLVFLLLANQYQYQYVYAYSNASLPMFYKLSAFWAGQEGSFLLWVCLHVVFGMILRRELKKRHSGVHTAVMAIYSLILVGLLVIVLAKSPFTLLAETPTDGSGLNPLLQNIWMVAHPPVLFLGYAALAVPFSWAIGSLICGDHTSWLRPALKWSLFGWAALGLGIFMGAYWAYEVLGWGGYWAWDPVENSSLIPWLIVGALVHFLLVAIRRSSAIKPAYLAAVFSFSSALYGTFLTRSGVLSDFSTHSFADQGIGVALVVLVAAVLIPALIFLIVKWPSIPGGDSGEQVQTRGFMTIVGGIALCTLAAIVLLGTSFPLLTLLLGNTQSVDASFYNTTSLPLVASFFLLMIIASILVWTKREKPVSKMQIAVMAVGLVAAASLSVVYVIYKNVMAVIVLGLAGAAIVACVIGIKKGMSKPSVLTHVGFACLIIGVIISSAASQTEIAVFDVGETKMFFGKSFTYLGQEMYDDDKGYDDRFTIDGEEYNATTRYDDSGAYSVHEPTVFRTLAYDIYLAPSLDQSGAEGEKEEYELIMDEPTTIEAYNMELTLLDIGMITENDETTGVYAMVDITLDGRTEQVRVYMELMDTVYITADVTAFEKYNLNLMMVSVSNSKILITVSEISDDTQTSETTDRVIAEISKKPLINLVWLGTIVISVGTVWAAVKRRRPVLCAQDVPDIS